jgi:hypothetical protein
VTVVLKVPKGTPSKQLDIEFTPTTMRVGLRGQEPILDGKLLDRIHVDNSTWTLESDGELTLELSKVNKMAWWKAVLEGDPTINTRDIVPENSKMDDLDRDTPPEWRK